jgi:hypothetical protein
MILTRAVLPVVLAVVVTVVGLGTLVQQQVAETVEGPSSIQPIRSSTLLCPEPGTGGDLAVRVSAAVIPGQVGQTDGPGSATLQTLPGQESASAQMSAPGDQAQIDSTGDRLPPVLARAAGSLAPGFVADQWGRDTRGRGRGLASTACAAPASEYWFVGGGAVAGRVTRALLVNPDETAAIVDVIVYGTDGILDAPAGRGLVVPPQSRINVRLDVLVPGESATALQVIARTGRIGASVNDIQQSGLDAVGTDWIPPAAAPATRVYVPGVLPQAGARVLSLVSPTENEAIVRIRLITPQGTFAPVERAEVRVPAQSVVTIDMSPVLEGLPATLELTADEPIVAGMRQFFGGRRVQNETSFTAGAQPFTTAAAVSGLPVRASTDVRVMVTAPTEDVEVEFAALAYRGDDDPSELVALRTVRVSAGEVRFIRLQPPRGAQWFTAVATPAPGSGPMLIAHRIREQSNFGDLVTGYPWPPLRTEVSIPFASEDVGITVR